MEMIYDNEKRSWKSRRHSYKRILAAFPLIESRLHRSQKQLTVSVKQLIVVQKQMGARL